MSRKVLELLMALVVGAPVVFVIGLILTEHWGPELPRFSAMWWLFVGFHGTGVIGVISGALALVFLGGLNQGGSAPRAGA